MCFSAGVAVFPALSTNIFETLEVVRGCPNITANYEIISTVFINV